MNQCSLCSQPIPASTVLWPGMVLKCSVNGVLSFTLLVVGLYLIASFFLLRINLRAGSLARKVSGTQGLWHAN